MCCKGATVQQQQGGGRCARARCLCTVVVELDVCFGFPPADDAFKIKAYSPDAKAASATYLGPTFGGPITKLLPFRCAGSSSRLSCMFAHAMHEVVYYKCLDYKGILRMRHAIGLPYGDALPAYHTHASAFRLQVCD
jgi:hypothetical protein